MRVSPCVSWFVYPPLGSLVRRESRKCDNHLMSSEVPTHTHTHTHTHARSIDVVQPQADWFLSVLWDCRLCFHSTKAPALSSTSPMLSFIPHLHPCHSPFFSPSTRHPFLPDFFRLHLYFSVPPPPPPPPLHSFCPFIPTSETVGDGSYWSRLQNQRSGQPISSRANRVTIIHEALQLLCRLHPLPCMHMQSSSPPLYLYCTFPSVHEYPSWVYSLFTTARLRDKGHFIQAGVSLLHFHIYFVHFFKKKKKENLD